MAGVLTLSKLFFLILQTSPCGEVGFGIRLKHQGKNRKLARRSEVCCEHHDTKNVSEFSKFRVGFHVLSKCLSQTLRFFPNTMDFQWNLV